MDRHKRLILLGPPASGKGTQARFLSQLFDVPTLSTGSMLRKEIEGQTELGKQAQRYMEAGKFVPDELVNAMVKDWIAHLPECSFLLDGYPRTLAQAESLQDFLDRECGGLDCAIWMNVTREVIEDRITHRVECSSCGFVTQGEAGGACPHCEGGVLKARVDDALDRFVHRWADFEALTLPVTDFYAQRGLVVKVTVDKEREVSDVSDELCAKLEDYFSQKKSLL